MHWDNFTDPASADEAKGHATRKALDDRRFSKRQVARVYSGVVPQNSEDAAALMAAVRPNATVIMQTPELKDVFKFRVRMVPEAELDCSADEGIPDADSIPRSFNATKSARMVALMATAWSKKGYKGKIPKIDDLVIVECFYSDFEMTVSLENVEFVEVLRSDCTPNDLQKRRGNVGSRLSALYTGDWSGVPHATAGHTSNHMPSTPGGTGVTPDAEKCASGEFCDYRYKALFNSGPRSKKPTSIVIHATAGGMGAGRALRGARRCAKKPYGPTTHLTCTMKQIAAGECAADASGKQRLKCNGSKICTEKGDPFLLHQTKVSPHYFVDQGGTVAEACSPDLVGNHAPGWNYVSIGIEHTGHPQRHPNMWTPELLKASAQLSAGLCWRYGIEPKRITTNDNTQTGFVGHEVTSPGQRTDPGEHFPWDKYIAMVKKFMAEGNHATESPKDIASGVSAEGSNGKPHDMSPGSEPAYVLESSTEEDPAEKCPAGSAYHEAGSDEETSWEAGCYDEDGVWVEPKE